MAGLKEKARGRELKSEKRKPMKLIIGTADHSTSSFVNETTIKLDPKVKGRGTGKAGLNIGARKRSGGTTGAGITSGMGGRSR